jgi:hypothetical protein
LSRRKPGRRTASGRLSRAAERKEYAPTLIRRARDAAFHRYGDKRWGTELGRMYLIGNLQEHHVAAGERWATLMAKFHAAIDAPPTNARTANLQIGLHAAHPDPDSDLGQLLAQTEIGVVKRLRKAHDALLQAGSSSEKTVRALCERDVSIGWWLYPALTAGLQRLAEHWHLTERR